MLVRLSAVALIAAAPLLVAAPASATEACASKNFGEKANGLFVTACVGDERESVVYVTCGSYTMRCA